MEHDFWHQRWERGQIGFHTPNAHWALAEHWPTLTHHPDEPVLVPLCGKSLDMTWLQERGHPVTGIELNSIAVRDFFKEWGRQPQLIQSSKHELPGYQAETLELWQGDFFRYVPDAGFRLFYDRAALIALPTEMRRRYLKHLRRCLKVGASGLLVTLEYEQNLKDGPPFSVAFEEIDGSNLFDVEPLERRDALEDNPKFKNAGISSLHETAYRLIAQ
ncbi:MAG: thiopurine S-methyltransferase [Wenzhouxiangella sp.]|jgi:thiopurine S-methyltransferase|nr:thiopurine S-methyltransferase [Wenzhouxiangella sp.]